ncbi:uncharacterized protein METZ01_LOCUS100547 [marine metagenome]|jgi:ADP-heptose:LPS heptosyltransferase|uniref:Glycosyltransferase family 9 (Heptosyltransferase) n=1 Tax=marine metagenome TaxID=408172 RepID=A0A381W710_9ZZZZ|tara:strand:- start:488 stop:1459 length:972 start_codon:yes stop_codon:yes gene_type:complete
MKNILYYYHDSCGIGDFYLLFPLFDALRSKYKDDNITLLSTNSIKNIAYNKKWFDNYINTFETEYPINRFDRVYNWDIQKHGITLFYPPKKHFWEIISDNLDITLDRDKFPDIFRLNITDEEKHLVDEFLNNDIYFSSGSFQPAKGPTIVLHTGHPYKFPYGKTPNYEWWHELTTKLPNANFIQVGTKEEPPQDKPSRIVPDFHVQAENCFDLRDMINIRQVAYLLECTDTFVAIDSIVAHVSLHSNKKGIVLWGSSNPKTHGHEHNINLEAIRHCGQPPCIDKGSFYVPDDLNQRCCLLPENARKDVWPLVDEVVYEINSIL